MIIASEKELLDAVARTLPPVGRVLVLAPHPDDEVFGCGGALCLLREAGVEVLQLVLTDGVLGGDNTDGGLTAIREEESLAAARILGLSPPVFWREPDRGLNYGEVLIGRLAEAIEEAGADLVFLPAPTELHPDHQVVAFAGAEALRRLGGARQAAFYELNAPLATPNLILDISRAAEKKQAAMRCFRSQLVEQPYDTRIIGLNSYRAFFIGQQASSAEAFVLAPAAELGEALPALFAGVPLHRRQQGFAVCGADLPLVSIVVRSMDRPTLAEALDSLALQTWPNLEVLVVNAKGGEHRELDDHCGRFPLRIVNQGGAGLSRVRAANAGLAACRGEFLGFLDDDDTVDPDHLHHLVAALQKADGIAVAYAGVRGLRRGDPEHTEISRFAEAGVSFARLFLGNVIPIHAVLFPASLLPRGVRFDESLDLYEDWDFWLQLSQLAPFIFVDRISATYYLGGGSGVSPLAPDWDKVRSARNVLSVKWLKLIAPEQLQEVEVLYSQAVASRDDRIARLQQTIVERDGLINQAEQTIAERDGLINQAKQTIAERDGHIAEAEQIIAERDGLIMHANQAIAEQDGLIRQAEQAAAEQVAHLARLSQTLAELNQTLAGRDAHIAALQASTSWRLTLPLRWGGQQLKRARHLWRIMPALVKHGGGLGSTLGKCLFVLRQEGLAGIRTRISLAQTSWGNISSGATTYGRNDYDEWLRRYDTLTEDSRAGMQKRLAEFAATPLISVIMPTYRPKPEWLLAAIDSVRRQLYPHWELCIADDASDDPATREILEGLAATEPRIKVVFRSTNGHIAAASNSALELVTGEWVALLDHDDLIAEHALFHVAAAINAHPEARLIYSDEDKVDVMGNRMSPYFKCDWNRDLFYSHNMITHLGVYRTDLVRSLAGFRLGTEGAQDYDLALRYIEQIEPEQIVHIPRILYHWREHQASTAQSADAKPYAMLAGERVLNEHLARLGIDARAELIGHGFRVRYALPPEPPLVSLIIPTRNGLRFIRQCVESILTKTTYPSYEIIIIDNNSDEAEALAYFRQIEKDSRVRVIRDERPFNFSALNNAGVALAQGEVVGLLNNDLEVISPDWLTEMVSLALQPGVGAVGARLLYPNDTIQHGGIILGIGGWAGHAHKGFPSACLGYSARASLIQGFSAVTGACLVVRKETFDKLGGLNETELQVACNDVEFCLRLRAAGLRNVWTPYAELYHHESATRGYEDTSEKQARFMRELAFVKERWPEMFRLDPAYSPNLTLAHEDFSLAWPPRVEDLPIPPNQHFTRTDKILLQIDRNRLGLEIGPSHRPVAPRKDGFMVKILDHLSADGLREKYKGHGVDLNAIEEVDYIWSGQPMSELVGKERFAWIIASHVIEHVPDLISFLGECEKVLTDDGVLSLAIPDKRYCFDHFREATSLAQVIDAHQTGCVMPSEGTAADYFLNVVKKGGVIAWNREDGGGFEAVHGLSEAQAAMASIRQGMYVDLHVWCFTPASFRLLIADLFALGYTTFKEKTFSETVGHEFFMTLTKGEGGCLLDRLTLQEMKAQDGC